MPRPLWHVRLFGFINFSLIYRLHSCLYPWLSVTMKLPSTLQPIQYSMKGQSTSRSIAILFKTRLLLVLSSCYWFVLTINWLMCSPNRCRRLFFFLYYPRWLSLIIPLLNSTNSFDFLELQQSRSAIYSYTIVHSPIEIYTESKIKRTKVFFFPFFCATKNNYVLS